MPTIYVACLAAYNNGKLHGVRIDLDDVDGLDELWARVNAMLAASPEPDAEEWAIHDYEGFGEWRLSEWEDFSKLMVVAKLMEDRGEHQVAGWLANDSTPVDEAIQENRGSDGKVDIDGAFHDAEQRFSEAYRGTWDSERDYAEDFVDQVGLPDVGHQKVMTGPFSDQEGEPVKDALYSYLDWDALTRWAMQDCWTCNVDHGSIAVFQHV